VSAIPSNDNHLPDGVYVNLPAETYFAQDRLGSTDLVVLHKDPADYYYRSKHNPHRKAKKASDEMVFGSGLHALTLEGEKAYVDGFKIRPDTYEDAKTGEIKPWNGNSNVCKAWLEANERPNVSIIDASADRRIRHMDALIQHHPELGEAMKAGMSEVSVLWTDPSGVKMRARFDKLLPLFILDLKTFGGDAKGDTTKQQCLGLVASRSMDVQRFSYAQARAAMASLPIFGATPDQEAWLKKVAAVKDWQWGWVFYRRQDDEKGHAPVVKPILRSPRDATYLIGEKKVATAIANYQTFVARFGFDVPWAVVEVTEEPQDHEFPPWLERIHEPITFPDTLKEAA
jgi:hypothetical protein